MYIIKNAIKSITRNKGRNILLTIIALVIAISACVALSIREAAETAKADTIGGMSITAKLSYDRALSYNPDIILADEPTGNLDMETQGEIMDIFRRLADEGKCIIIVTHSPDVAAVADVTYDLVRSA